MTDGPGALAERLDDVELSAADPSGMLETVTSTPRMWRRALEIAKHAPAPPVVAGDVRAVVVAGMGGSGISGDVAALAAATYGDVPVSVAKGYRLPSWVGEDTLVIAASYSGNTEETLSCLDQALDAGAPVFAVTSGGKVGELASTHGFPAVEIPGGQQPRASLPYLAGPVLNALDVMGVAPGLSDELASIPGVLDPLAALWGPDAATQHNEAKQAAAALADLVPVFYGGRGWPALVALRGKCQVNENSKRPSFHHELPELDHNEVVGWELLPEVTERIGLVELRSEDDEHPQTAKRFAVTMDLVADGFGEVVTHELRGARPLLRFATGTLFVDLLSVYLAFIGGVDPTPVDRITELKRRIAA